MTSIVTLMVYTVVYTTCENHPKILAKPTPSTPINETSLTIYCFDYQRLLRVVLDRIELPTHGFSVRCSTD